MVGQQVRALFHDHNPVGVKLKPLFVILGIIIKGRLFGNKQKRIVGNQTFGFAVDYPSRIGKIIKLFVIKRIVFLRLDFIFILAPEGNHAVQGLNLFKRFKLMLFRIFQPLLLHFHLNGVGNIIRIFLYNTRNPVLI